MQTPKSKFVKNKIKNLEYNRENVRYIEDLLLLERFVLTGYSFELDFMADFKINQLSKEYNKEYKAIFNELDTEGFKEKQKELEKSDEKLSKGIIKNKILWRRLNVKDLIIWERFNGKVSKNCKNRRL